MSCFCCFFGELLLSLNEIERWLVVDDGSNSKKAFPCDLHGALRPSEANPRQSSKNVTTDGSVVNSVAALLQMSLPSKQKPLVFEQHTLPEPFIFKSFQTTQNPNKKRKGLWDFPEIFHFSRPADSAAGGSLGWRRGSHLRTLQEGTAEIAPGDLAEPSGEVVHLDGF